MKKNVFILLIVACLGLLFYKFQSQAKVLSPKESISQNIKKLKDGGEISSDQESFMKVQLAVVDYMAVKHNPPDSLEALVPKYFSSVPINPKTKKPFQYERRGGSYVILDYTSSNSEGASPKETAKKVSEEFLNPNNLVIEDFVYNSEGKRDPFRPFDLAPKTSLGEDVPPLERYDISQLKVSAVLTDSVNGMVAIVEDATGKGYTVKVGSRIGDKNGTVVSIDNAQVNVLEKVTDFTGEVKQDLRSIKLQKSSGKYKGKKKRN